MQHEKELTLIPKNMLTPIVTTGSAQVDGGCCDCFYMRCACDYQ